MTELPAGLHGAHLRTDLVAELGRAEVRALVDERCLVPLGRAVLVERRTMLTPDTRAAAALLAAGPEAALTGPTAALVHGCSSGAAGTVHVLVPYQRKARTWPGVLLHHGHFDDEDTVQRNGLRTLVLDRVIADLLCDAPRPVALSCADQALALIEPRFRADFKATVAERIMQRLDSRGRRRSAVLLELASGLPESPAESRMLLHLADAGLPLPVLQHPVRNIDGAVRYWLDFAWLEPRIALEYDGYEAHAERHQRDELRDRDLTRRGWLVLHADHTDLRDPTALITRIRTAFRQRQYAA